MAMACITFRELWRQNPARIRRPTRTPLRNTQRARPTRALRPDHEGRCSDHAPDGRSNRTCHARLHGRCILYIQRIECTYTGVFLAGHGLTDPHPLAGNWHRIDGPCGDGSAGLAAGAATAYGLPHGLGRYLVRVHGSAGSETAIGTEINIMS